MTAQHRYELLNEELSCLLIDDAEAEEEYRAI